MEAYGNTEPSNRAKSATVARTRCAFSQHRDKAHAGRGTTHPCAAEADGKAPSEWARDLLLGGAAATVRGEMEMHIFTELVGLQMLLMGTLDPLLRGETRTPDQVANLFRQVQTTKAARAQELLAKRSQKKETM